MKYFGIFNHIKAFINKRLVRQLYFAFIYSRISYGIEIFGNSSTANLSRMQVIQNKLLKLVLEMDRMTPTNSLHVNLHLLKVSDIFKVNTIVFVNNSLLKLCPRNFNDYFTTYMNNYNLRNTGLRVPYARTVIGSQSVKVQGARLWNDLPDFIKQLRYQKNFKKHIVKYFIEQYRNE